MAEWLGAGHPHLRPLDDPGDLEGPVLLLRVRCARICGMLLSPQNKGEFGMPTVSREELLAHLRDQIQFLDTSSRSYDAGQDEEAKRLATAIRVLVHDTATSHSILGQLGEKERIQYWSVLMAECVGEAKSYCGIGIQMRASGTRYVPLLLPAARRLQFAQWWESSPLLVEGTERLTRKRAVLLLANKDGGAHVDPTLGVSDQRVLKSDPMDFQPITLEGASETVVKEEQVQIGDQRVIVRVSHFDGGKTTYDPPLPSPSRAAVRQIAHELCGSIRESLGHLL